MVFHKVCRCQQSDKSKSFGVNSTSCEAFVDIKIKKITKATKRYDPYLKGMAPLSAVVKVREDHNHALDCADGLRLLRPSPGTRASFYNYFKDGLSRAEAMTLHRQKLVAGENDAIQLPSGALIPSGGTVYHWFRIWRKEHYGHTVDPLSKLAGKAPSYLQHGVDVTTTKSSDGTCWAVLVVTGIMKRAQGLDAAREIVFLDSTASCDESQCSVTVVLAATPAGAIPLAVLLHSSQSTESYAAAFGLLKRKYPFCIGGAHAPKAFMTDNSAAKKAALQATWPEATQLLCHFHVARAEWRWLQASRNNVSRDERRELMSAFQKLTTGKLEADPQMLCLFAVIQGLLRRCCKKTWEILRALLNRAKPKATLLEKIQKFILNFPDNSEGILEAVKTEFFGEHPLQRTTKYPNCEGVDNTQLEKSFTREKMEAALG
ncbi:uncharacterized protein LOC115331187 [Ixodes scapularis]|uniref:uncharacterized protein LOC115331187 n=1 Tax=Ixodes scapularis TaxID=6945 RepID=UPI001C38518D|nr:uncharacterized protein LOC115331187 [Ixodes scapularis]